MLEKRVSDVVAAHERWAYGEGWTAGLDEGRRHGFEEGFDAGFDAGADVIVGRLRTALTAIAGGWPPDLLEQRCRRDGLASSDGQCPEAML